MPATLRRFSNQRGHGKKAFGIKENLRKRSLRRLENLRYIFRKAIVADNIRSGNVLASERQVIS